MKIEGDEVLLRVFSEKSEDGRYKSIIWFEGIRWESKQLFASEFDAMAAYNGLEKFVIKKSIIFNEN